MALPRVSIIIPTYNRCELLRSTIDSVLTQTLTDYELIVVDDGSTDDTRTLVEHYCQQHPGRVRYIFQQNAGESVARQHGVDISQGILLAFLDSDDLWLPTKLEKQVSFLEQHPDAAFVYCWASVIDRAGHPVQWPVLGSLNDQAGFSLQKLVLGNFIVGPGSTLLLRRAAYNACGGFNPRIRFAEDWDLCLRLGVDHRFGCVCEPLVQVRLYERGWHQKRENLPSMLRDHLLLIESFYAIPKVAESKLTQVKAQALANRYINAGFAHLAYGEHTEGRACIAKACELAPEQWANSNGLMQAAANHAISLLAPNHPEKRAEDFIDRVGENLPPILEDGSITSSRMKGWLYVTLAHHQRHLGNTDAVPRLVLRAMWADPTWRRNRGLWSLLMRATLGQFGVSTQSKSTSSIDRYWMTSLDTM